MMEVVEGLAKDADYCYECKEELAYVYIVDERGNIGKKLCQSCYLAMVEGMENEE